MRIHFISIGGAIMHQLAIVLQKKGYTISGSDDAVFEPAKSNLEKHDLLPPIIGYDSERITPDIACIIVGMHTRKDNPELQKAQALNLKIFSFPAYIYEQTKHQKRIVIAGSHGKTSTTAMLMHVLKKDGVPFDYLIGTAIKGFPYSIKLAGETPYFIAEGDEYLASPLHLIPKFLYYQPHIAVITGIAWDHINVFPTFEVYTENFKKFIHTIVSGGTLIYNETDTVLQKIIRECKRQDIHFFPYHTPQYKVEKEITYLTENGQKIPLHIFGMHNLLNLSGAQKAATFFRIPAEKFYENISDFKGASRRMERIIKKRNYEVYRDFAHAPSKAGATIKALQENFPNKNLTVFFELHTYSSLNKEFIKEYKNVFDGLSDIYIYYSFKALSAKKLPPLSETDIRKEITNPNVQIINNPDDLVQVAKNIVLNNSVIVLMSSGNFDATEWGKIF